MGSGRAGFRAALKADPTPAGAPNSLASDEPSISRIQATAQLIDRSRTVPGDMVVTGSIQEQDQRPVQETLGIAGAGVIACGLAAAAARAGEVVLWARSDNSADRARARVEKLCAKELEGEAAAGKIEVVREFDALSGTSFLVEAVWRTTPARLRFCPSSLTSRAMTPSSPPRRPRFRSPSWRARPAPPSAFSVSTCSTP